MELDGGQGPGAGEITAGGCRTAGAGGRTTGDGRVGGEAEEGGGCWDTEGGRKRDVNKVFYQLTQRAQRPSAQQTTSKTVRGGIKCQGHEEKGSIPLARHMLA